MFLDSREENKMATKKACILHTPEKKAAADEVAKRLKEKGYAVCVTEVSTETAKAVKAGDKASLPADVADCLEGADVCIVLVDEQGSLATIGGLASDGGCRVV